MLQNHLQRTFYVKIFRSLDSLPEGRHIDMLIGRVLKEYFSMYINISGLFAGFQSFVITTFVENDHLQRLQEAAVFMYMLSFGCNICACLTAVVAHNALIGGMFDRRMICINKLCAVWIAFAILFYITSFLIHTYQTYRYTSQYFVMVFVLIGTNTVIIGKTLLFTEYTKTYQSQDILDNIRNVLDIQSNVEQYTNTIAV